MGRRSDVDGSGKLYLSELRLALRNNAGAYGYSVMITSSSLVVSTITRSPSVGEVFLFLLGVVLSFAIIETLATRLFTKPMDDEEESKIIALGSSLNLVSVAFSVGAAFLASVLLPTDVAWPVSGFLASVIYLLMAAGEMSIARRIEELRQVAE